MGAPVHALIRLAEVVAAFTVAEHTVGDAEFGQHLRRDLTRVGAALLPVNVLCTDRNIRSANRLGDSRKRCRRRTDHNGRLCVLNKRSKFLHESDPRCDRVVHFPVACNNRCSCHMLFSSMIVRFTRPPMPRCPAVLCPRGVPTSRRRPLRCARSGRRVLSS